MYIEDSALKDQRLPDLRSWAGDGIIADFDDPAVARLVMQSRLPAVAFGGGYGWYVKGSPIPYFFANKAIARLAADHLLERGFKHFAFCDNVLNNVNFGQPAANISNTNVGTITAAADARSMQLGFRVTW